MCTFYDLLLYYKHALQVLMRLVLHRFFLLSYFPVYKPGPEYKPVPFTSWVKSGTRSYISWGPNISRGRESLNITFLVITSLLIGVFAQFLHVYKRELLL